MEQSRPAADGLRIALEMERRGRHLYARARHLVTDSAMLTLLRSLEQDELLHHEQFSAMLAAMGAPILSREENELLAAKAADFFFPGGLMQAAMDGALQSREALLEEAMQAERDSISFYSVLLTHLGEQERPGLEAILREEEGHLRTLSAIRDETKKTNNNQGGTRMIAREPMGLLPGGEAVDKYRLQNSSGAYVEISTLGGCLLSIHVPDRDGKLGDVTLGYETLDALRSASGYMGFLIGRVGNRIGNAQFDLNGKTYVLAQNDGENHLHGGNAGFDKKLWAGEIQGDALVLRTTSPDGDEGYPGTLTAVVTYAFTEDNVLRIRYEAETDADTPVNLTNHVYFNLSGPASLTLANHGIQINADAFTEVGDRACIPTGRLAPVDGTPLDLRAPRNIGEGLAQTQQCEQMRYGGGYDHNFAIRGWDRNLRQAAVVTDRVSGRRLETWTDQPGIQFYSGNMIGGNTPGKRGVPYIPRQGFCLETQHFPDSVHHPLFPSCVLKRGEKYDTTTEYRFSLA